MRRLSLAMVCVVLACPAAWANQKPLFYFGKANVSDDEYRRDHDACSYKAAKPTMKSAQTPIQPYLGPSVAPTGAPPQVQGGGTAMTVDFTPNPAVFVQCMLAKGYKQGLPPMPGGKAGLYEFRKLAHEAPAQIYQLCVPADGGKMLVRLTGLSPSCTYSNVMEAPHGFAADASCQGDQRFHVVMQSSVPEHREFIVSRPAMPGTPPRTEKLQIDWTSEACGSLPTGSIRTPDGRVVPTTP